jgi:hypothetical protein
MPKKDPQNPAPAPARKRAGRIARKASGAPAEFIPDDSLPPPPPAPGPMAPAMASADCFDAGAVAERFGIWWQNSKDGAYHMPGPDGRWLELNPGNIRAALLADGIEGKRPKDGPLSDCDRLLLFAREHRAVDLTIDALAGSFAGCHTIGGRRVLVRRSPTIIKPERGEGWPIWSAILDGILGTQKWHFLAWVKLAYEALVTGSRDRGQICILCGPQGGGKSRLQNNLLTPVLGGRVANPTNWLFGVDRFNSQLAGSEHLAVEELPAIMRGDTRAVLKERLKMLCVCDTFSVEGKFSEAANLDPFWRTSITVNDQQETILMLPALTPDLADKVLLFRAMKVPMPMPTVTSAEKLAFRETLAAELPSILYDLTETYDLRNQHPHLFGGRFGLREYHDPGLAARLREDAPEMELLDLIQRWLAPGGEWTGSASDLEGQLESSDSVSESATRFFRKMGAAKLLGRLDGEMPGVVFRGRDKDKRWWCIKLPVAS